MTASMGCGVFYIMHRLNIKSRLKMFVVHANHITATVHLTVVVYIRLLVCLAFAPILAGNCGEGII